MACSVLGKLDCASGTLLALVDYWIALGVLITTAATDAAYVMFTSAVVAKTALSAANWSSACYMLISFAVISYTSNWIYVCFAVIGSYIGAYLTPRYFHHQLSHPPTPLKPTA
jgi:hypothetical protein